MNPLVCWKSSTPTYLTKNQLTTAVYKGALERLNSSAKGLWSSKSPHVYQLLSREHCPSRDWGVQFSTSAPPILAAHFMAASWCDGPRCLAGTLGISTSSSQEHPEGCRGRAKCILTANWGQRQNRTWKGTCALASMSNGENSSSHIIANLHPVIFNVDLKGAIFHLICVQPSVATNDCRASPLNVLILLYVYEITCMWSLVIRSHFSPLFAFSKLK